MTEPLPLFVYGSLLRRTGRREIDVLLRRSVRARREARIAARLYDLGPYPAAVLESDGRHQVRGQLLELSHARRTLARLDRYEDQGREFRRERALAVTTASGQRHACWVYTYVRPIAFRPRIARGDYRAHCARRATTARTHGH